MSKITIYVFRHGETDWNAERRFQGHTDIPLNDKGREQAQQLGKILKTLNLQAILCSDLSRAQETAQIATKDLNIPIHITKNLREAFLGEPEGKLRDDIIKIYGQESWEKWSSVKPEDIDFTYPNGETKTAQLQRVLDFVLDYIQQNHAITTFAISTHGGTLRRLVHFCEGAPQHSIPIPNCSIYKLEFHRLENRWSFHGQLVESSASDTIFS